MKKQLSIDPVIIETRDIKAKFMKMYYFESGDIDSYRSWGGVTKVEIINKTYQINFDTDIFDMEFYKKYNIIKSLHLRGKSNKLFYKKLAEDSKKNFQINGVDMNIFYNEKNEITECRVIDNIKAMFISEKYLCKGKSIIYSLLSNSILISDNAKVEIEKKNIFRSVELIIDTKNEKLFSKKPVLAKIILEQKSVLLSKNPIYINSDLIEIDEKKKQ